VKYAYDIEAYRSGDDAELFPLPQKWFESPLTTGSVFQHENYELCVTEILATGPSEVEAVERGLAVIRERAEDESAD
jgi:hypothetical protein